MKKFVVLLVVVALTLISAIAYAEVTLSGELAIRSRDFSNMDMNEDVTDGNTTQQRDTQTRFKLDVNAKVGDVKGKLELWNDFESWGTAAAPASANTFETQPGGTIRAREAWINFNLPGLPVNVTGGHQLLSLGNGWFFRSMHFGSDAWVVANQAGNNTVAVVNVKFEENEAALSDDTDAYVILDVLKLSDAMTVGAELTNLKARHAVDLKNLGLNFNGKLGPVALKAELDLQFGSVETGPGTESDFAGNQLVVQGSLPLDPLTVNFTVARGSGQDRTSTSTDIDEFQNALDIDPHYTFLYEYKMGRKDLAPAGSPAGTTRKNFGFANTTALGVGATFAATKSLTVGADLWWLQATEDVLDLKSGTGTTSDIGQEIDIKLNWQVAENLSWNWVAGIFMPGDGMSAKGDDATGIQGILAFKF